MAAKKLFSPTIKKQVIAKQNLEDDAATFALEYLTHFFHDPDEGMITKAQIEEYTKEFQTLIGLSPDGELSSQTVKAMQTMPRCGCKDFGLISPQAVGTPCWKDGAFTYYIDSYVSGISKSDQDSLIALAFKQWADVTNLKITRVMSPQQANVTISTGRGAGDQFDGPSGTLAWAYLPPQPDFEGQLMMKFDLDETWITNAADRGILFLNVATHEFGHLLGLEHSKNSKALMAPYYATSISKPQNNDDIIRIQNIYGQPVLPPILPTPPVAPTAPTEIPAGKLRVEIFIDNLSDVHIDGKVASDFSLI